MDPNKWKEGDGIKVVNERVEEIKDELVKGVEKLGLNIVEAIQCSFRPVIELTTHEGELNAFVYLGLAVIAT